MDYYIKYDYEKFMTARNVYFITLMEVKTVKKFIWDRPSIICILSKLSDKPRSPQV